MERKGILGKKPCGPSLEVEKHGDKRSSVAATW